MVSYSKHFLQQVEIRNITLDCIENALQNPDTIVREDNLMVYQKQITEAGRLYILRIFVNEDKEPPLVVTAIKLRELKNTVRYESEI